MIITDKGSKNSQKKENNIQFGVDASDISADLELHVGSTQVLLKKTSTEKDLLLQFEKA